ncbi:AAA family ATPase [Aeoliella sp. ICT_H6.2]|uniref:AAA family ATPase n=1 Tax=Aeoliella straminimaris TaxID=2954799 RepID=A0A9X2JI90_9BACT|nr:AAA family ATPase [Aeoliella straminimaris]MCO6046616.1 AAA family ATPase [Aeoliella straminimaris]
MSNPETDPVEPATQRLGHQLRAEVLEPLKSSFVGKDEIVDLLGLCLVARENLFMLGPPGTAKSALVQALARQIDGRVFDYLLTRFTEPNEIFGPFDIRKLREGELETNTSGMLPEADFVFLDELLNANSAILNSLLLVLNERVFRRGRETRALPTLMVVGASNHLPEDEALGALFDRFLIRVNCNNVSDESLGEVLAAGWKMDSRSEAHPADITAEDLRALQRLVPQVAFEAIRPKYVELVVKLRSAGVNISDRRAVKLQRLMAASALLCGRLEANLTDMWVLRYIWDTEDEQELLASLVSQALDASSDQERAVGHPRSLVSDAPDVEQLEADLSRAATMLASADASDRSVLRDRLTLLTARCQWVVDAQQRNFLENKANELWRSLDAQT